MHLAYLVEKLGKTPPGTILPLKTKAAAYAKFYNGSHSAAAYAKNISKYNEEALKFLDANPGSLAAHKTPSNPQAPVDSGKSAASTKPPLSVTVPASPSGPITLDEIQIEVATDTLKELKKACIHLKGETRASCATASSKYDQNEHMLDLLISSKLQLPDEEVIDLREYYCSRLTSLLDGEFSGKYKRPSGKHWRQILADRRIELEDKCLDGE